MSNQSKAVTLPAPYAWAGMGYRDNGDGYGIIRNAETHRTYKLGAGEVRWSSSVETYKQAAIRAFLQRPEIIAEQEQRCPATRLVKWYDDETGKDTKQSLYVRKDLVDVLIAALQRMVSEAENNGGRVRHTATSASKAELRRVTAEIEADRR